MNNAQLDMVLGYLNEGTEIDMEEYLSEGRKIKKGYWKGSKYYGWDPDGERYMEFESDEAYDDWFEENFGDPSGYSVFANILL